MSVYSGFATRHQQKKYNSLLQTLVIALKKRLIKFYNKTQSDEEKFKLLIKKIYKKMFILEKGKFMPPKFTSCFTDLIDTLKIQINYDTMSECSSIHSQQLTFRKKSIDFQPQEMISNNALKIKVNELEKQQDYKRHLSALSAPRRVKYLRQQIQNQEDQEGVKKIENKKRMTLSFVDQKKESPMGRQKSRAVQLIDIRELRGTCHMPHFEDFVPKRSQIIPPTPSRSQNQLIIYKADKKKQQAPGQTFRRQKYVRASLKVQDI